MSRDLLMQPQTILSARDVALKALTKIEDHEAECNRREELRVRRDEHFQQQYDLDTAELKAGLKDLHDRISGVDRSIRALVSGVGGTAILGLMGIVGWLLIHGRPWEMTP